MDLGAEAGADRSPAWSPRGWPILGRGRTPSAGSEALTPGWCRIWPRSGPRSADLGASAQDGRWSLVQTLPASDDAGALRRNPATARDTGELPRRPYFSTRSRPPARRGAAGRAARVASPRTAVPSLADRTGPAGWSARRHGSLRPRRCRRRTGAAPSRAPVGGTPLATDRVNTLRVRAKAAGRARWRGRGRPRPRAGPSGHRAARPRTRLPDRRSSDAASAPWPSPASSSRSSMSLGPGDPSRSTRAVPAGGLLLRAARSARRCRPRRSAPRDRGFLRGPVVEEGPREILHDGRSPRR